MTQPLWFLRHAGKVYGPFPAPQIADALKQGDIARDWEISLDEIDWLTIAESAQFDEVPPTEPPADVEAAVWREERRRARARWLGVEAESDVPTPGGPAHDATLREAVARDHVRTEAMLRAERERALPWRLVVLALLAIAVLGGLIWMMQRPTPIQADVAPATADCAAALAPGVNWRGCRRPGLSAPDARARGALLEGAQLDDAVLARADLAYAYLRGASLRNVDLTGATLTGADLGGADLSGANLTDADLRQAVLRGARLTGVRLNQAQLAGAVWNDGRVCQPASLGACR